MTSVFSEYYHILPIILFEKFFTSVPLSASSLLKLQDSTTNHWVTTHNTKCSKLYVTWSPQLLSSFLSCSQFSEWMIQLLPCSGCAIKSIKPFVASYIDTESPACAKYRFQLVLALFILLLSVGLSCSNNCPVIFGGRPNIPSHYIIGCTLSVSQYPTYPFLVCHTYKQCSALLHLAPTFF